MDLLRRLLGAAEPPPDELPTDLPREQGPLAEPIERRVLMIVHNPTFPMRGGQKLHQVFNWNDPDTLARQYVADVREASHGYANYTIAERVEVDGFPIKQDGFAYTPQGYLDAWRTRRFHDPDGVDYPRLVREFDMVEKVSSGAIDEVWLFGFPYEGCWESTMAGPGAFWCNSPPLAGTEPAARRFVIMGFNFERGVGEMLEDLGHRTESIMSKVFERTRGPANLWERFTRYDQTHPGRAECGTVHFAPNSLRDYDWGNPRPVWSRCDTWRRFPDLAGEPRRVTCAEWGNGDIRRHHLWWLSHLPPWPGETHGISHNWWQYVIDPNTVQV